MLVHHSNTFGNSVLRSAKIYWYSIYQYFAAISLLQAIENIHQSGLASSVLAQKGVDLSMMQVKFCSL